LNQGLHREGLSNHCLCQWKVHLLRVACRAADGQLCGSTGNWKQRGGRACLWVQGGVAAEPAADGRAAVAPCVARGPGRRASRRSWAARDVAAASRCGRRAIAAAASRTVYGPVRGGVGAITDRPRPAPERPAGAAAVLRRRHDVVRAHHQHRTLDHAMHKKSLSRFTLFPA